MKDLVIYHGNCADGFGAAWCFWNKYGEKLDYYPGVYQEPPPDVTGRIVYLVDFSYKLPALRKMLTEAERVFIIDHHKSAIEELAGFEHPKLTKFLDPTHSGAMLAWKYTHGGRPPQLLRHIEDRDLWKFELPGTRAIQANLFSYPYEFAVWDRLMRMSAEELLTFAEAGEAIERKHFKDIRELLNVVGRRMVIAGHDVPVANLPYTMSSDAGHLMAVAEPFSACYYDTPEGRCFSLRSAEDGLDVSAIAKLYGGGGHKHAAGFRVGWDHPLARGER